MRHCTRDNSRRDVLTICLCDGKIINVSHVRDASNPGPGHLRLHKATSYYFTPTKYTLSGPGPGHPDHNRISEYNPQQIKHQIVEGNI